MTSNSRTARCGPACRVVWQGRLPSWRPPMPIRNSSMSSQAVATGSLVSLRARSMGRAGIVTRTGGHPERVRAAAVQRPRGRSRTRAGRAIGSGALHLQIPVAPWPSSSGALFDGCRPRRRWRKSGVSPGWATVCMNTHAHGCCIGAAAAAAMWLTLGSGPAGGLSHRRCRAGADCLRHGLPGLGGAHQARTPSPPSARCPGPMNARREPRPEAPRQSPKLRIGEVRMTCT